MNNTIFEQIKRINEYAQEYWSARDLFKILGYTEYGKFIPAIDRAKESCKNSSQKPKDHFAHVSEMVPLGSGAEREIDDYHLSRYACYLIAQNGDPRKEEVALAQTYFALQTRKQEMADEMLEDSKRVFLRDEMTTHNKRLVSAAKDAGVTRFGQFQDYGYMGLYGGLRQKDIHVKKGLKPKEKILDHMGSEELAANLFRATQTEAKLRREEIQGEEKANQTHLEVGKKVRVTIRGLGGTMPEELPVKEGIVITKRRLGKVVKAVGSKELTRGI